MSKNTKRWLGRTAYQIMPDRFYRVGEPLTSLPDGKVVKSWSDRKVDWEPAADGEYYNQYYWGGNLKGIIAKLDYLKSLGVGLIYHTPIGLAASNHRYDPIDQAEIDPILGTWEEYRELCNEAHKRDILVVPDLVFNHTSNKSVYLQDPQLRSEYYEENENGDLPYWCVFKDMIECNKHSRRYQDDMTEIVRKYLVHGADGIRLDLAEILSTDFLQALTRVRDEFPEVLFIGECWGFADEMLKVLDSSMNYPIDDAILRWVRWGMDLHFLYNFQRVYSSYPEESLPVLLNIADSHDTIRLITMLVAEYMNGDVFSGQIWDIEAPWRGPNSFDTYGFRKRESELDVIEGEMYDLGKKLAKMVLAILYTIPGIPCIFQGTELGETGFKDPFNRKPMNWDNYDTDMLQFVSTMGQYRIENSDILPEGKFEIVRVDADVLIIERYQEECGHIYLAINRTSSPKEIAIPDNGKAFKQIYSNGKNSITKLDSYGIYIVRQ